MIVEMFHFGQRKSSRICLYVKRVEQERYCFCHSTLSVRESYRVERLYFQNNAKRMGNILFSRRKLSIITVKNQIKNIRDPLASVDRERLA